MTSMTDEELLRYSRQLLLPEIDIDGQLVLKQSRVLIVGLGGLGCPVAMYLAAAGVGKLVLVDPDVVELSNLQRQIAHSDADIGDTKVASAARSIKAINPHVDVACHAVAASEAWLLQQLDDIDLVMDCTDRASIRYQINDACLSSGTPWVSAAAIGMAGQLTQFDPNNDQSPCYGCLYPALDDTEMTCAESGVVAPLVGVMGSMQALEALKWLTGTGDSLVGRLISFDAKSHRWQDWKLGRNQDCPACH